MIKKIKKKVNIKTKIIFTKEYLQKQLFNKVKEKIKDINKNNVEDIIDLFICEIIPIDLESLSQYGVDFEFNYNIEEKYYFETLSDLLYVCIQDDLYKTCIKNYTKWKRKLTINNMFNY